MRFEPYRTNLQSVFGQVQAARIRGYSLRDVGLVQGTKVAFGLGQEPRWRSAAAITLSAVRRRLNPRREAEVAEVLLAAARDVEAAIKADSSSVVMAKSH